MQSYKEHITEEGALNMQINNILIHLFDIQKELDQVRNTTHLNQLDLVVRLANQRSRVRFLPQLQNLFSTRRICSREERRKQLDDISSHLHSLFACSRNKIAKWKMGLSQLY